MTIQAEITPQKTNVYTFWELLSKNSIEIPIIQRDYAQGRTTGNETAIRHELLDSIYNALIAKEPLDFDFIYGTVAVESKKLFPLDGQQRLTTFFLLHWYLAQKEDKMAYARNYLYKFSYTTRISSRDFCNMLVRLEYKPEEKISPTSYIKDANGYYLSWDNDPTVKAMLVMLDAIHEKFFHCEPLFNDLINKDLALLSFNYLQMEDYALTDDLYIKMNARGKALTTFENFKAKFIQHLRERSYPYQYFENKIDGQWLDLLWDYRDSDNTIDNQFMNLFSYLTNMIFLVSEKPKECEAPFHPTGIRELVEYYDQREKVELLYSLLDLWSGKDEAESVLRSIFVVERSDDNRVRLFERQDTCVFSDVIVGNPVTLQNRILLFAVMMRYVKLGKDTDIESMKNYSRVVRNLLLNARYYQKSSYKYTADFRFGRNGIPYTQFFVSVLAESLDIYDAIINAECEGINAESLQQEARKARIIQDNPENKSVIHGLEDSDLFKSSIFNVLDLAIELNDNSLIDTLEALFCEQYGAQIIRGILSFGNYGIYLGYTVLGKKLFFGNIKQWYDILSFSGDKVYQNCLVSFIKAFYETYSGADISGTIEEVIQNNLLSIDINDWRYCLLKYPSTLSNSFDIYNTNYVLVFEDQDGLITLHRMNGKTLNAAHVVPEYIEAAIQLKDICSPSICGQGSEDLGGINLICSYTLKRKIKDNPFGLKFINMHFGEDGSIVVSNYEKEDESLIESSFEEYDDMNETHDYDLVEQIVTLARIIDRKYHEAYAEGSLC